MKKTILFKCTKLLMLSHGVYFRGLRFVRQQSVPIPYKGIKLGTDLRLDLSRKGFFELVEEKVIVDLKAKDKLSPIDKPNLDKPKFSQRDALGTNFKFIIIPSALSIKTLFKLGIITAFQIAIQNTKVLDS